MHCISHLDEQIKKQIEQELNELMIVLKIKKGFIAQSKFADFNKILIKYNVFLQCVKLDTTKNIYRIRNDNKGYIDFKNLLNNKTILITCIPINDHYCAIKKYDRKRTLTNIILDLNFKCIKKDIDIQDIMNNDINHFEKKIKPIYKYNQFNNVYVWDSETIVDENNNLDVYACAFINLGLLVKSKYDAVTKEKQFTHMEILSEAHRRYVSMYYKG